MKVSPNEADPKADVEFIVQELLDLFASAEDESPEPCMCLESHLGSTFHARVMNAARHLGLT